MAKTEDEIKKDSEGSDESEDLSPIPVLYEIWVLDCLVVLANAVSWDFAKRPRHYADVDEKIAMSCSNFRTKTGADPDFQNTEQRTWNQAAMFGSSPSSPLAAETHPFHGAAADLRRAAVAYSERVYNTGEAMLRQSFLDSARVLQAYLSTLKGSVIKRNFSELSGVFDKAIMIMKTAEIAKAFGLPPAPNNDWPVGEVYDGNGSFLIEEISNKTSSELPTPISQKRFLVLQRIAVNGAKTLTGVLLLDSIEKDENRVRLLIGCAYAWETAIRSLGDTRNPTNNA